MDNPERFNLKKIIEDICDSHGLKCTYWGGETDFEATEEAKKDLSDKIQSPISILQNRIKFLEEENFKLGAYQCRNPVSSEYGDMLCKDVVALNAKNYELKKSLKEMVNEFDMFGKSASQNGAMNAAKIVLQQKEEQ